MIIRKRSDHAVGAMDLDELDYAETPVIRMWEQVNKLGRTFYVPLDQDFEPIGDLALEDVSDDEAYRLANSMQVLPSFQRPDAWDPGTESLVAQCIERILAEGDATTYEVYEALMGRLHFSRLLEADVSVDLLRILAHNFHCYEFQSDRGVALRKWTLHSERATPSKQLPSALTSTWGSFIERSLN